MTYANNGLLWQGEPLGFPMLLALWEDCGT